MKYKNDDRIWQINGWSPIRKNRKQFSYLTHHAHIWGWASWKRVFDLYEPEIPWFHTNYAFQTLEIFQNLDLKPRFLDFWYNNLKKCSEGFDTWDTQWLANMWHHNMYAIAPSKSLCGNVGFDHRATHTTRSGGVAFSYLPKLDLRFDNQELELDKKKINFYNEIHDQIGYKIGNNLFLQIQKTLRGIN